MAQRANKKKLTNTIHKKLKNQRKDFHNKLSLKLVRENHSIVNSNISYKMLMKSKLKGHAKAWQDIGQGYFRSILNNKAAKLLDYISSSGLIKNKASHAPWHSSLSRGILVVYAGEDVNSTVFC